MLMLETTRNVAVSSKSTLCELLTQTTKYLPIAVMLWNTSPKGVLFAAWNTSPKT
jgi:hypothetical protein